MRLFVESGPLAGAQIELDRAHPATLGSGPGCTIRVQDPGVAAEHAVVKALRDEGFGVKALAPGLRVNGVEVEATPLADGDLLEIGTTRLLYGQERKAAGPRIAGFQILGELGRGGMGTVYLAEQQSLHRQVALKVLDQRLLRDPQFVARFVAEARAAAKLSHPNVVHVFDVDHDGETYYYAMELMHHGSLEAWLREHGRMPVERALQVIADAAAGLAYAESLRMVHGDIKPDNLMLDQHGTVKIADLGLARSEEDGGETLTGTPHFMAPEQVLRRPADHRTDLYALGCTFYRLVTGRTPFRGQTVKDILRAQVKDTPEPAHKVEPSVPADVSAIIQRLMAKEPADRYPSATDLLADVTLLLQPPARRGLWIGLAATAVLVAGGTAYWAFNKQGKTKIVEVKYDDPEKQQFADEIKRLNAQAREDAATIALLRARLDGGSGLELAASLDAVAGAHPDTRAAADAAALAARLRAEVFAQQAASRRQQEAAATALAALGKAVDAALQAGDPVQAWRAVKAAAAPADADAEAFAAGLPPQRERVLAAAREQARALGAGVGGARAAGDLVALQGAAARIEKILAADGGWPAELLPDRPALERALQDARSAVADLVAAARVAEWQRYDALLRAPDGVLAAVAACDFARAAAQLTEFASGLGDVPAQHRAQALAAALATAAPFGDALAAAAGKGQLTLAGPGDSLLPVARWQRQDGTFVLLDQSKRPAREVVQPMSSLTPEQWDALTAQVPDAPAPGRLCFLAFVALAEHIGKARSYLAAIQPGNDETGTGAAGFPYGSLLFEQALRQVPADGGPWCDGIRDELQAGRLLASGLRALSERRNLAAAAHLEQLLGSYPHSVVVVALP